MPSQIGRLTRFHTLLLGGNQLVKLPSSIGQLVGSQKLSLSGSGLQELPPDIGSLTSLTYLNLSQTLIKELPVDMCHLTQLKELNLYENYYLEEIPEAVFEREPAEMIRYILAWQQSKRSKTVVEKSKALSPEPEQVKSRELAIVA